MLWLMLIKYADMTFVLLFTFECTFLLSHAQFLFCYSNDCRFNQVIVKWVSRKEQIKCIHTNKTNHLSLKYIKRITAVLHISSNTVITDDRKWSIATLLNFLSLFNTSHNQQRQNETNVFIQFSLIATWNAFPTARSNPICFYFHYSIFDFASQQLPTGKTATPLPGWAGLITVIC